MKVLETQSAHLTNHEVLDHVEGMRARYRGVARRRPSAASMKSSNLETMMKELTEYLRRDPSPLASPSGFSNATIRALFGAMQPYNLTKAEMLMLLNLRPQSIPVLDAIIEEMEARFTNEEQERILAVVEEILDRGPDQDVASAATQFVGQMRQDRASRMNETNA